MSYSYRAEFIDMILDIKTDILNEVSQQILDASPNSSPA